VHPDARNSKLAQLFVLNAGIGDSPKMSDYREGKAHLFLGPKLGGMFHLCASFDPRYICCSTHVVSHISNCPFECTYCFLQN